MAKINIELNATIEVDDETYMLLFGDGDETSWAALQTKLKESLKADRVELTDVWRTDE